MSNSNWYPYVATSITNQCHLALVCILYRSGCQTRSCSIRSFWTWATGSIHIHVSASGTTYSTNNEVHHRLFSTHTLTTIAICDIKSSHPTYIVRYHGLSNPTTRSPVFNDVTRTYVPILLHVNTTLLDKDISADVLNHAVSSRYIRFIQIDISPIVLLPRCTM
jgi:hypothetical protein